MTLRYHQQEELPAGDDWEIYGDLLNRQGQPLPLAGVAFEWELRNEKTGVVAVATDEVTITVLDALLGKIRIDVPNDITADLDAGRYQDTLRIATPKKSTMWRGPILVSRNLGG